MAKPKWTDEKRNDEVRGSEMRLGFLRINVHRHIDHPPDVWLGTCFPIGIERRRLVSVILEDAKDEFVRVIFAHIEDAHALIVPMVKK